MSIALVRILILLVIFFGALVAIIATAGKEWTQWEDDAGTLKVTSGLWETCIEKEGVRRNCTTIIVSHLTKGNVKGWFMCSNHFILRLWLIFGIVFFSNLFFFTFTK